MSQVKTLKLPAVREAAGEDMEPFVHAQDWDALEYGICGTRLRNPNGPEFPYLTCPVCIAMEEQGP